MLRYHIFHTSHISQPLHICVVDHWQTQICDICDISTWVDIGGPLADAPMLDIH
jgi:hypothetical protein